MSKVKTMKKVAIYAATFTIMILLSLGVWIALRFQTDMRLARQRVAEGSQIIETGCGSIEYGQIGDGPPVLVIHGAGGGYNQGLLLGRMVIGDGFRLIAPSRFGYLNSPIPADSSLEAQADAFVCLLDALGIDQVSVVAISAGGPSGLQFALSYPERTSALVMASAISFKEPSSPQERKIEADINRLVGSDIVYWLAVNIAPKPLIELLGVPRSVQENLNAEDQAIMVQDLESMYPMSARLEGILLDQSRTLPRDYPLDEIQAPTLVIHARDDKLVNYEQGEHTARSIPGAAFFSLPDGGHFLIGHYEEIHSEIYSFLSAQIAEAGK